MSTKHLDHEMPVVPLDPHCILKERHALAIAFKQHTLRHAFRLPLRQELAGLGRAHETATNPADRLVFAEAHQVGDKPVAVPVRWGYAHRTGLEPAAP
jgi:hypothetical protein